MGLYVIAAGGSGSKILESLVYAACADVLTDENGSPVSVLHALSVDVDTACGNTTRAIRTAEKYGHLCDCLEGTAHECFHTRVDVRRWSVDLDLRAGSVGQLASGSAADRLLASSLFTKAEMELEYAEGFRGHPDLGVLFFSSLLSALEEKRAAGLRDEMNTFLDDMEADMAKGETVRLLLLGSVFGGTGAGAMPALSRFFRARYADRTDLFILGAMFMLPYFTVPPTWETEGITVRSDEFMDKARAALRFYAGDRLVRSGENDTAGIYDAVYMLGLPLEECVCVENYSTGSETQLNGAHVMEWFAGRDCAQFFRTSFRGEGAANMNCYYTQLHTPVFGWGSFDAEEEVFRSGYGRLLKAFAFYFAECEPVLMRCIRPLPCFERKVGYAAPYFRRVTGARQRAAVEKQLLAFSDFGRGYAEWLAQVLKNLPPVMRSDGSAPEGLEPCDLLELSVMDALLQLLRQSGESDTASGRGKKATRRYWAVLIQEKLDRLIMSPVPDLTDARKIASLLGEGNLKASETDRAFSAFAAALLSASGVTQA